MTRPGGPSVLTETGIRPSHHLCGERRDAAPIFSSDAAQSFGAGTELPAHEQPALRSSPQALSAPNLPTEPLRHNTLSKTSQWGSSGPYQISTARPGRENRALTSTQFLGHFARFSFVPVELQTTAQDALDVMSAR